MADLLLDRFERLKTIKTTGKKSIELYINRNTGEKAVAKIQSAALLKDSRVRNVLHEASFTQTLQGYHGIPFMYWSGKTKDQRIVLLLQQLGHNLNDLFKMCDNRFSLKTVCMLGIQMIELVKTVHDKGFVISNVSMEIFQFGRGQKCLDLYINDLSECLNYRDAKTMAHILEPKEYYRSPANIFESIAVYANREKSRKDDMESLVLILVYMLKGELPWSKTFKRSQKYVKPTQKMLQQISDIKKICEKTPKPFTDLLEDCRSLKFHEEPPYHWMILKLKSILYTTGEQYNFVYDWLLSPAYTATQKIDVRARNPNIKLDQDEEFLGYLEEKVFPFVDVDEINTKYEVLYAQYDRDREKSRTKISQSEGYNQGYSHDDHGDEVMEVQIDANESPEKQKEKDKSVPESAMKKSQNTKNPAKNKSINVSVLQRKKKKQQQCSLM